jgi:hypothetical protein
MKDNNKYIEAHGKKGILAEGAEHGVRAEGKTSQPGQEYSGIEDDKEYGPATSVSDPDAGPEPAEK